MFNRNQYETDEFYKLSNLLDDDLGAIACLIAKDGKEAKVIYKDLIFGRYKSEHVKRLKESIKQTLISKAQNLLQSSVIFSRDDFTNIEAYSVFKRQYNKGAVNG